MLPAAYRLTHRQDFSVVVRRGRRAGRRRLVVHALVGFETGPQTDTDPRTDSDPAIGAADQPGDTHAPLSADHSGTSRGAGSTASTPTRELHPPRVGFVVSKAVGGSVIRHQVTRRLRHLMRSKLSALPAGTGVVVRALGPAATATSAELGADLDAALRRLLPQRTLDGGTG